ncbi:hypothetical protein VNI00_016172, partial [Paramarasmius palmivorus]
MDANPAATPIVDQSSFCTQNNMNKSSVAAMQWHDGSDPLNVVALITPLPCWYILCARFINFRIASPPPSWSFITQLSRALTQTQADKLQKKDATLEDCWA